MKKHLLLIKALFIFSTINTFGAVQIPVGNTGSYAERGGIIPAMVNSKDNKLYIFLGKSTYNGYVFNFPSGSIENGDTIVADAAWREAIEETGGTKHSALAKKTGFSAQAIAKLPYIFSNRHHILLYFYLNNTLTEKELTQSCQAALNDLHAKKCEKEVSEYKAVALNELINSAQKLATFKSNNAGQYPQGVNHPLYTVQAKDGSTIVVERHYLAVCAEDLVGLKKLATPPTILVQTPTQKVTPPVKKIIPPAKKVIPPAKKIIPPAKKVIPPAKKVIPPAKKIIPPAKKNSTPPVLKKIITTTTPSKESLPATKRLGILLFKRYEDKEPYSIIVGLNSKTGFYEIISDDFSANFTLTTHSFVALNSLTHTHLSFLDNAVNNRDFDPSGDDVTFFVKSSINPSNVFYFIHSKNASVSEFEKAKNLKYLKFAAIPVKNLIQTAQNVENYMMMHNNQLPLQTDPLCKTTSRSSNTPNNITLSINDLKELVKLWKVIMDLSGS